MVQATKPGPSAPKLTPETLEKEIQELQDLAARARQETTSKFILEQLSVLFKSISLLLLAALYSTISQLTLSPVYGGIPAAVWHSRLVMIACFLGWSSNTWIRSRVSFSPVEALPVIAAWIPVVQFVLFRWSAVLGSTAGPIVTEGVTFAPLLLVSVGSTATILEGLELGALGKRIADAAPGIGAYAFFKTAEKYGGTFIMRVLGKGLVFSRVGLQLVLVNLYSLRAPSKLLLYAAPAMLHTVAFNHHFEGAMISTAESVLKKDNYTLLARKDSNTGYISVLESDENHFRVMRCDHSLLGGNWMAGALNVPEKKRIVSEPIYGVFAMLEAIRLVELPVPIVDADANALVIGLGIGTTPAALMAHGIDTTIVEIDPVVFEYAIDYFGLQPSHTPVIQDAVTYTSHLAHNTTQTYSYIVHDVFTGGAEPVDLFTAEFMANLHAILKPGGVIAINYAGDLLLPSARLIVRTITATFPSCRIFRESAAPSLETIKEDGQDFTNMVIFCTKEQAPIGFRRPSEEDFLQSGARRMFLLPRFEIPEERFWPQEGDGDVLRANETQRLEEWQIKSARGHWSVMRTVLPASVWENW